MRFLAPLGVWEFPTLAWADSQFQSWNIHFGQRWFQEIPGKTEAIKLKILVYRLCNPPSFFVSCCSKDMHLFIPGKLWVKTDGRCEVPEDNHFGQPKAHQMFGKPWAIRILLVNEHPRGCSRCQCFGMKFQKFQYSQIPTSILVWVVSIYNLHSGFTYVVYLGIKPNIHLALNLPGACTKLC